LNTNPDIRWKQRFQKFDRVFVLLRSAMENGPDALNPLEKEGVIQRFKYCVELAWKTMKDYLEEGGFIFAAVMPRLAAELHAQFAESAKLDQAIKRNLESLGYGL
jgi:Nucleotidyltransferase substrate binding protein like